MIHDIEKVRAHIRLGGRVQGVAFRFYTRDRAYQFGIKGWIKNLADGDVEAVLEGERSSVQQMIGWCKKGPSLAIVERFTVDWQPYTGEFNHFSIR